MSKLPTWDAIISGLDSLFKRAYIGRGDGAGYALNIAEIRGRHSAELSAHVDNVSRQVLAESRAGNSYQGSTCYTSNCRGHFRNVRKQELTIRDASKRSTKVIWIIALVGWSKKAQRTLIRKHACRTTSPANIFRILDHKGKVVCSCSHIQRRS